MIDWQLILVVFLVFGAIGYLILRVRKAIRPKQGCSGDCGCSLRSGRVPPSR